MRKKFSTKNQLNTPKKQAAAGRALEGRLETWLGRVRKRVSRNEQASKATAQQVTDLEIKLALLETRMQALEAQRTSQP